MMRAPMMSAVMTGALTATMSTERREDGCMKRAV
jgi:hypothetical protein